MWGSLLAAPLHGGLGQRSCAPPLAGGSAAVLEASQGRQSMRPGSDAAAGQEAAAQQEAPRAVPRFARRCDCPPCAARHSSWSPLVHTWETGIYTRTTCTAASCLLRLSNGLSSLHLHAFNSFWVQMHTLAPPPPPPPLAITLHNQAELTVRLKPPPPPRPLPPLSRPPLQRSHPRARPRRRRPPRRPCSQSRPPRRRAACRCSRPPPCALPETLAPLRVKQVSSTASV